MARVIDINISTRKGVTKTSVDQGECIVDFGIKGDAHGGNWHRQISLLGVESIEKMRALGIEDLISGSFAENITTQGIELNTLPVGTKLVIAEVILEITQIGKECHHKCAIYNKVGECIMPTEGIFAKVTQGGIIKPGDEIKII